MNDQSGNHHGDEDAPQFDSMVQRRLENESAGLGAALAEQLRNAPWYMGSVGIHLAIFALLMLIPSEAPKPPSAPVVIDIQNVDEQELMDETPPEDSDIVEMVEFPTEITELRPIDQNIDMSLALEVPEDIAPVEMSADIADDILDFTEVTPPTIAIRTTTPTSAFSKRNSAQSRIRATRQHITNRPGQIDQRVNDALEWLKAHQENDGHWDAAKYGGGSDKSNVAVTSLATLAFLGAGNSPKSGKHRNEVRKAVKWLLDQQDKSGRIGPHSYVHAIALMAVTEAYGMSNDRGLRERAQLATDYAAKTQSNDGGWDYTPNNEKRSDLSVAGWYIMGLKSAKQSGLKVDDGVMKKADAFVDMMTTTAGTRPDNIFAGSAQGHYVSENRGKPTGGSQALTAVSLTTFQFLERPRTNPKVAVCGQTVIKNGPPTTGRGTQFYRWYYGALGLFQYGGDPELRDDPTMGPYVEAWRKWCNPMVDTLLRIQVRTGSFRDNKGSWNPETDGHGRSWGRVGQTALAALMLEVFYRYDFVQQSRRAMMNS